jgi:hypothetical protein
MPCELNHGSSGNVVVVVVVFVDVVVFVKNPEGVSGTRE